MQLENHKEEVPFAHYVRKFREGNWGEDPNRLPGTRFDGQNFHVRLMRREFLISHPEYAIRALAEGEIPPLTAQTFLLRYLMEGRNVPWLGKWKTFREMPWGEMYATPFAGRALSRAAFTFGTRLDAFKAACENLGGIPVAHGDAGFEFDFVGNYKMRIFIWEGDEEFPPSAQILYSDNFAEGFTAEDRVVAADILIANLKANM